MRSWFSAYIGRSGNNRLAQTFDEVFAELITDYTDRNGAVLGYQVAGQYKEMDALAKALGCTLSAPFMTLSFMALLVIPELKLSDRGLFDGAAFQFIDPFIGSSEESG